MWLVGPEEHGTKSSRRKEKIVTWWEREGEKRQSACLWQEGQGGDGKKGSNHGPGGTLAFGRSETGVA